MKHTRHETLWEALGYDGVSKPLPSKTVTHETMAHQKGKQS